LRLLTKDYDFLSPLATGDVEVDGVELIYERDSAGALYRGLHDPSIDIGEFSLARHLIRVSTGDFRIFPVPFFPARLFYHRNFLVRQGSELHSLADLDGKRIGCNEWPSTGKVWARAALRDQGVVYEGISWWVGPIDDGPPPSSRPDLEPDELPAIAHRIPVGTTQIDMLLGGELDVVIRGLRAPRGFSTTRGLVVRLLPDYRRAEREYFSRTGLYPAHHFIGIRRPIFDKYPWLARNLYEALEGSKHRWQMERTNLADATPWLLAEIEETQEVMGADWLPGGLEANQRMLETLCGEMLSQKLINRPVTPAEVFGEFHTGAG
jgi:4,5-dihydroxyphthalate decarboxylase